MQMPIFIFLFCFKVITRLAGMEEVTALNVTFSLEQEIRLILLVPTWYTRHFYFQS